MNLTEQELKAIEREEKIKIITKILNDQKIVRYENFFQKAMLRAMDEWAERERIKAKKLLEALEKVKAVFPNTVRLPISVEILGIVNEAINEYNKNS